MESGLDPQMSNTSGAESLMKMGSGLFGYLFRISDFPFLFSLMGFFGGVFIYLFIKIQLTFFTHVFWSGAHITEEDARSEHLAVMRYLIAGIAITNPR